MCAYTLYKLRHLPASLLQYFYIRKEKPKGENLQTGIIAYRAGPVVGRGGAL